MVIKEVKEIFIPVKNLKEEQKNRCISCWRRTNILNKKGFCACCLLGYGGNPQVKKPSKYEENFFVDKYKNAEDKHNESK